MKRCVIAAVGGPMSSVRILAGPEKVADGKGRSKPITHNEAHPVRSTSLTFRLAVVLEISSRSPSRT